MKQRSGSSSLSALKLKSFASLVKWCAAHYTRHMKCHVSLRGLYGLCVNARTDSGKSQAVWMNQNQTIPGWFPEHITRVFSRISVWKRLKWGSRASVLPNSTAPHILQCKYVVKSGTAVHCNWELFGKFWDNPARLFSCYIISLQTKMISVRFSCMCLNQVSN